jgi:radical SAM protein with 4Fe4S-binding SPASM domain
LNNKTKTHYSSKDWKLYLEKNLLPPNPPARPISPFIPKNYKQIINLIKLVYGLGLSLITRRPFTWGNPIIAHIEPTSLCNLKCPLCPAGVGSVSRKKSRLDFKQFKIIIDKLPTTIRMLLLWNQGEPFLVKDLPKMIKYAKNHDIYTVTSTNGHFFRKEEFVEEIVKSGIDEIIISLDGADQEVYEKYRIGGRLDWVFEGIKNIAEMKNHLKLSQPLLHIQFLLMQHNIHQQEDMIEIGKKLGADRFSFKTIQVSDFENGEDYLPENPIYTRYETNTEDGKHITKKRKIFSNECLRLWYSFVINCDGRVSPCCFDKDGDYALGNLIEDSFESIWYGEKFQKFRQSLLKNRYGFHMCSDCTEGLKEIYQQTIDYQRDNK